MRAWVSVLYKYPYEKIIKVCIETLNKLNIEVIYPGILNLPNNTSKLINTIEKEIKSCDFLIADITEYTIGVLTEISFAIESEKPILFIRNPPNLTI